MSSEKVGGCLPRHPRISNHQPWLFKTDLTGGAGLAPPLFYPPNPSVIDVGASLSDG